MSEAKPSRSPSPNPGPNLSPNPGPNLSPSPSIGPSPSSSHECPTMDILKEFRTSGHPAAFLDQYDLRTAIILKRTSLALLKEYISGSFSVLTVTDTNKRQVKGKNLRLA